jgi:uncharacterized protein YkwD
MRYAKRSWRMLIVLSISQCLVFGLDVKSSSSISSSSEQPTIEKPFETQMLYLTNQYRVHNGLARLVLDETLTKLAREHSQEMALQGFISHDLPSGSLNSRMARAGYFHEAARENVAVSGSISWAHSALLKSPMHKKNIVAADINKIGIGIVRAPDPCSRKLYITEIFATPHPVHPVEAIQEELFARINNLRQNGAGALTADPMLERLALSSLNSLPYPYDKETLQSLLASSAQTLQNSGRSELSRVTIHVQLVRDPLLLQLPAQPGGQEASAYGSAIRKVLDSANQPAFMVITLIGFSNRPAMNVMALR